MVVDTLAKFQYLRVLPKGSIITIHLDGYDPEPVELKRRGRQQIRVSRGDEEFLVDINDVVVEN